uniref:DnaJ_C domain-containing protein n=1 Tax=Macrostomum lignano TaxID=282301 RepID=A0A1I8HVB5_9PLAT
SLDLQLEGGTPFEHQVEVDSNLSKPGANQSTGGLFRGSQQNKQPRIHLKFTMPNREVKEFME